MILINLKGGLGNQMFQYAFARRAALDLNTKLKLDPSGLVALGFLEANTPRRFALDIFNMEIDIATPEEVRKIKYPLGIISKGLRFLIPKITRDFKIIFKPSLLRVRDGSYIDGFFQDERFFDTYADVIRKDFTSRHELSPKAQEIKRQIEVAGIHSASLHIRRGDYVNDPKTAAYWNAPSISYYEKAFKHLPSGSVIFVFSDDIAWVKENLKLDAEMHFVSDPTLKDYEELQLMSFCHNHIIANSSFSWWAAWLGEKSGSITVAPERWTGGIRYPESPVPPRWIRVE
jgi:hypothetical protein